MKQQKSVSFPQDNASIKILFLAIQDMIKKDYALDNPNLNNFQTGFMYEHRFDQA